MTEKKSGPPYYFSLQPSEKAIFQGACDIYAAYIAAGHVNKSNAKEMQNRAIQEAIRIGQIVEDSIESDDEMRSKPLGG